MVDHTDHFEEGRRAAGYIRVSSANQDTHLSVAAQKREIAEFAQANGLEIVGWYVDGEDDEARTMTVMTPLLFLRDSYS